MDKGTRGFILVLVLALLIVSFVYIMAACTVDNPEESKEETLPARFKFIGTAEVLHPSIDCNLAEAVQYYVDIETQIIYVVIINHSGNGTWAGFTPLVDTDGTYVTYDEL